MKDKSTYNSENQQPYKFFFSVDNKAGLHEEPPWYQSHPDISIPLLLIAVGLFQFILRKWILPVPKDVIEKLENQFPSHGLLYMPEFGIFFVILGIILFIIFKIF